MSKQNAANAEAKLSIIPKTKKILELISPFTFVMRRFLKSKPPADISTPTPPTPPTKLVKDFASRRDPRALAATSTAVAISLGSAPHDTHDTPRDGVIVREKDTGWQTAYGAARMAVEIAKESSDILLPLKAVASAMSILIKNYDVSVSHSQTECLLIVCLFPAPANVR